MIDPNLIEAVKNLQPDQRPIAAALAHYYKKVKIAERDVEEIQAQLEHQSLEKLFPLQDPINEIINGIRAPTTEELAEIQDYLNPGEKIEDVKLKPFDNYWGTILYNCYKKHEGLLEEDQKVLKHLKSVYVAFTNDKNFKIRFEFEENEYFENKILEKEYFYNPERELPIKITGTDIKWKPGKNVTKKIHKKKQRNKKTGQQRIVEEEVDTGSFFQFFDDIRPAHTEIEEQQRENVIESQHLLGQDFLKQIIPNQVEFYLGIIELEDQSGPEMEDDMDDDGQSLDESD